MTPNSIPGESAEKIAEELAAFIIDLEDSIQCLEGDEVVERARTDAAMLRRAVGHLVVIVAERAACDARVREAEVAAYERAADIAELRSLALPNDSDMTRGYANGRKAAAAAIRALIGNQ